MEREVGGGIGMGNTCKSMADSFQCMTKPTTIKKKNHLLFDLSIFKLLLKKSQRCKYALVIREMQLKPQDTTLYSLGWLKSKSQITSISENVKQSKPSYTIDRNEKTIQPSWKIV